MTARPTFALLLTSVGPFSSAEPVAELQLLAGVPVLVETARRLRSCPGLAGAVLVATAPPQAMSQVRSLLTDELAPESIVVAGAGSLDGSLHNALEAVRSLLTPAEQLLDPMIVIHDACRPLVTDGLIERVLAAALADPSDSAVPIVPVTETIKRVGDDGRVTGMVARQGLFHVQLPQAAGLRRLTAVHARCRPAGDSELLCLAGADAARVSGDELAMPLLTERDRELALALRVG